MSLSICGKSPYSASKGTLGALYFIYLISGFEPATLQLQTEHPYAPRHTAPPNTICISMVPGVTLDANKGLETASPVPLSSVRSFSWELPSAPGFR